MRIAQAADRKTAPLSEQHVIIPMDRGFTAREMERIRAGLVPERMEDKWFIYWQAEHLFFHRSWAGACMYRARFQVEAASGE